MWPFKQKSEPVDKEWEDLCKRYEAVEAFAKIGDHVEYQGIKMLVIGLNKYTGAYSDPLPGIHTEWLDSLNRIQKMFIVDYLFPCCKVIRNESYPKDWKHCLIHLNPKTREMHSDGDHSVRTWIEDRIKLNQKIVETLAYYADPETYFAIGFASDPPCGDFINDFDDVTRKPGLKARTVLKEFLTKNPEFLKEEK
ncbi:MAG: hypothetical protein Q7R33_04725 [Nitrosarchaeum sp.]|nr:hypothetical protein [Nitrosarchaeum sp.]